MAAHGTPQHKAEELGLAPAPIESIDELVQVARHVLLADTSEGSVEPGLEVREDRVAPRQDLGRVGAIRSLDVTIVSHTHALQRHVAVESIGAHHGLSGVDRAAQEGPEISFERHAFEHGRLARLAV